MSDTSGPNLPASSVSAALQSCLGSRLRARLAEAGSPLYGLIWKDWAMASGPQICALRASAPRTSAKGSGGEGSLCTGWPTPSTMDNGNSGDAWEKRRAEVKAKGINGNGFGLILPMAAQLTGWPTPKVSDFKGADLARSENRTGARHSGDGLATVVTMAGWPTPTTADAARGVNPLDKKTTNVGMSVNDAAALAGWPTPTTTDATRGSPETPEAKRARGAHTGTSMIDAACLAGWPTPMAGTPAQNGYNEAGNTDSGRKTAALCGAQILGHGVTFDPDWTGPARRTHLGALQTGSSAAMDGGGQLNPAHSRWLMGYPPEWDACAPTETRSSRRSRQRSSEPSKRQPKK